MAIDAILSALAGATEPVVAERLLLELDQALTRHRGEAPGREIAAAALPFARHPATTEEPNSPETLAALRALRVLVTLSPVLPDDAVALLRLRGQEVGAAGVLALEALVKIAAEVPLVAEHARRHLLTLDLEAEPGYPGTSSDAAACRVLSVVARAGTGAECCIDAIVERCLLSARAARLNLAHVYTAALDALAAQGPLPVHVGAAAREVLELPRVGGAVKGRAWRVLARVSPRPATLVDELRARLALAQPDEAQAVVELLEPHLERAEVLEAMVAAARRVALSAPAVTVLARAGHITEAVAVLEALGAGPNADRLAAVEALDRSATVLPDAVRLLLPFAKDSAKEVRLAAARALLRQPSRTDEVVAALDALRRDRAAAVRELVARSRAK
ncbi:MAG: hypothetical protein IAE78_03230 [Myxococcus sp.]|nr:hypothetical protein [Myxococcus sp.]